MAAKKSKQRVEIVDAISKSLKSREIYTKLRVKDRTESELRAFMYRYLLDSLEEMYKERKPSVREATIKQNASDALLWDGDASTVINSLQFLGVQHRPDFEVKIEGIRIGIEVKRGKSGTDIRAGLGQAMVYSQAYDFVIYLFADTSKDKKIRESIRQTREKAFLDSIWDNYNIRFDIV